MEDLLHSLWVGAAVCGEKHFLEVFNTHVPILILNIVVHAFTHLIQNTIVNTHKVESFDDFHLLLEVVVGVSEDVQHIPFDDITAKSRWALSSAVFEMFIQLLFELLWVEIIFRADLSRVLEFF